MSDCQDLLTEHRAVMRAVHEAMHRLERTVMWDLSERGPDQAVVFLEWLPDLLRHEDAERIRRMYPGDTSEERRYRRDEIANMIDPFYVEADAIGILSWYRKEDRRLVPATVMHDPDPTYYPDKQREETRS